MIYLGEVLRLTIRATKEVNLAVSYISISEHLKVQRIGRVPLHVETITTSGQLICFVRTQRKQVFLIAVVKGMCPNPNIRPRFGFCRKRSILDEIGTPSPQALKSSGDALDRFLIRGLADKVAVYMVTDSFGSSR